MEVGEDNKTMGRRWYDQYLATPHWKAMRAAKLRQAGHECERCGEPAMEMEGAWFGLEVHHLTYERVGHEHFDDLMVLCRPCHAAQHGLEANAAEARRWARVRAARRYLGLSVGYWPDDIDVEVEAWDRIAESVAS